MRTSVVSSVAIVLPRITRVLVAVAGLLVFTSCGSSVATVTAPGQTRCDVDANAQNAAFSAAGGTGTLQITTNRECAWSVKTDAPWVTLTAPLSGQGTASVQYLGCCQSRSSVAQRGYTRGRSAAADRAGRISLSVSFVIHG